MAALEELDPMGQDYLDKLEHFRGAVAHHVYEEEATRFVQLREKASAFKQDQLGLRYKEEFQRYCGSADLQHRDRAASKNTTYIASR
jgi:hypothetical protein